jgi:hypothetical protein
MIRITVAEMVTVRVKKPWDHRFHQFKKPTGKPVKPTGFRAKKN